MLGHVLIGVGLALNIIATLFLSLDARRSQEDSKELLEIQQFLLTAELDRAKWEEAKAARTESERAVGSATLEGTGMTFDAVEQLTEGADKEADKANRKKYAEMMSAVSKRIETRYPYVTAAIFSVLAGGVMELAGAVFFTP